MPANFSLKKFLLLVFVLILLAKSAPAFAVRQTIYATVFDSIADWELNSLNDWTASIEETCGGNSAKGENTDELAQMNKTNINNTSSGTRGWQNLELNFTWHTLALDSAATEHLSVEYFVNGTRTLILNQTADQACIDRDTSLATTASETDFFGIRFVCKNSANSEYCIVDNLNLSGIPARFSFNESTAKTTVVAGSTINRESRITFSGNHSPPSFSEIDGNGTGFISANITQVPEANAKEGLTYDVRFTCAPSGGQAEGIYYAQYNVTSVQNNSSMYFRGTQNGFGAGEGIFLNCTVTPAPTVTWNETTRQIDTWRGFYKTTELRVTSSQTNNDVNVTEVDGNGTSITAPNATAIDLNMINGQVRDFNFTCQPSMTQALGVYWANYTVNSSENPTGQNATIKCNVLPSNLTYNETSPISTSIAQGASVNRDIQVWSNGSNNFTNITNAEAGAGNGSAFITKNATNLGNLINASSPDVRFTCAPPLEQALGVYEYNVSMNSTQNTTTINLTVRCQVTTAQDTTISVVTSTVSFQNMGIGETDNTDDLNPPPFVVRNDGNVNVNITVEATNLFLASGFGNPTAKYQWNTTANEAGSFQNNIMGENLFGYTDMPAGGSPTKCVGQLKSADPNDEAKININITIPTAELPGNRTSTVTLTASAA